MDNRIKAIFDNDVIKLSKSMDKLNERLERDSDTDIGRFMSRILDWTMTDKKQLLWELFHEAFDVGGLNFLDTFGSFVENCLLDDSAFRIDWVKYNAKTGDCDPSTEDDERAEPVVLWDNDGKQDVSLLMNAMDRKELNEKRGVELCNQLEDMLAQFHAKARSD